MNLRQHGVQGLPLIARDLVVGLNEFLPSCGRNSHVQQTCGQVGDQTDSDSCREGGRVVDVSLQQTKKSDQSLATFVDTLPAAQSHCIVAFSLNFSSNKLLRRCRRLDSGNGSPVFDDGPEDAVAGGVGCADGRLQGVVPLGRRSLLGRAVVQQHQKLLSGLHVRLEIVLRRRGAGGGRDDAVQNVADVLLGRSEGGRMPGEKSDQSLKDSLQLAGSASLVVDVGQTGGNEGRQSRGGDLPDEVGVIPSEHEDADQGNYGQRASGGGVRLLEEGQQRLDPAAGLAEHFKAASLDRGLDQDNGRPSAFNSAVLQESVELRLEAVDCDALIRVLLGRGCGGGEKVSAGPERGRHLGGDTRQLGHGSRRDAKGQLLEDSSPLGV